MKLRNLLVLGSMTAVVVAFMSCTKAEDLFDNDAYMAQKKSEYEANFVKKYGAVDPNKSWDLTSNHPQYSFPSEKSSTRAFTRNVTYSMARVLLTLSKVSCNGVFRIFLPVKTILIRVTPSI
jgi:hypothetical protein